MKPIFILLSSMFFAPFLCVSQTLEIENNQEIIQPILEGNWELIVKAPKAAIIKKNNPKGAIKKNINKKIIQPNKKNDNIIRVDSTVKVNADGSVETTIITIYKGDKEKTERKFTPAQSDKMHKAEKPMLRFFGESKAFSGFTGCNKLAGLYKISKNNEVDFSASSPSTRMVCMGAYNEDEFMNALKSVTHYKLENDQLNLLKEGKVILAFKRID